MPRKNSSLKNQELYQKRFEYQTEWRKKRHTTIEYHYNYYKYGAERRGVSFSLTQEEFKSYWQKNCVYGCEIATIGLDRIDNTKGYIVDNIQPCCRVHNKMKGTLTSEEFTEACRKVVTSIGEKK